MLVCIIVGCHPSDPVEQHGVETEAHGRGPNPGLDGVLAGTAGSSDVGQPRVERHIPIVVDRASENGQGKRADLICSRCLSRPEHVAVGEIPPAKVDGEGNERVGQLRPSRSSSEPMLSMSD
jgi:hypothetical protein